MTPSGLLLVLEMDAPPTFLPTSVGAGFEARMHQVLHGRGTDHPDWTDVLAAAGFGLVERRGFALAPAAVTHVERHYATAYYRRVHDAVLPRLSFADQQLLSALVSPDDPQSLLHRNDLSVHGTRTGWAARRSQ
jgi:hypothetical protein